MLATLAIESLLGAMVCHTLWQLKLLLTFSCQTCRVTMKCTIDEYCEHMLSHDVNVSHRDGLFQRLQFGNLLLVPGYGHLEMNLCRDIFKLGWNSYIMPLAKLLGFILSGHESLRQQEKITINLGQYCQVFLHGAAQAIICKYYEKETNDMSLSICLQVSV